LHKGEIKRSNPKQTQEERKKAKKYMQENRQVKKKKKKDHARNQVTFPGGSYLQTCPQGERYSTCSTRHRKEKKKNTATTLPRHVYFFLEKEKVTVNSKRGYTYHEGYIRVEFGGKGIKKRKEKKKNRRDLMQSSSYKRFFSFSINCNYATGHLLFKPSAHLLYSTSARSFVCSMPGISRPGRFIWCFSVHVSSSGICRDWRLRWLLRWGLFVARTSFGF
jgi:hypothetical protein